MDLGNVLELSRLICKDSGFCAVRQKFLADGLGVGDVGNIVLRDRKHLAEDGIIIVVMTIEKRERQCVSGPDIISMRFCLCSGIWKT